MICVIITYIFGLSACITRYLFYFLVLIIFPYLLFLIILFYLVLLLTLPVSLSLPYTLPRRSRLIYILCSARSFFQYCIWYVRARRIIFTITYYFCLFPVRDFVRRHHWYSFRVFVYSSQVGPNGSRATSEAVPGAYYQYKSQANYKTCILL